MYNIYIIFLLIISIIWDVFNSNLFQGINIELCICLILSISLRGVYRSLIFILALVFFIIKIYKEISEIYGVGVGDLYMHLNSIEAWPQSAYELMVILSVFIALSFLSVRPKFNKSKSVRIDFKSLVWGMLLIFIAAIVDFQSGIIIMAS